jgi:uncharacterized protein YqfB (UPF0267 family)
MSNYSVSVAGIATFTINPEDAALDDEQSLDRLITVEFDDSADFTEVGIISIKNEKDCCTVQIEASCLVEVEALHEKCAAQEAKNLFYTLMQVTFGSICQSSSWKMSDIHSDGVTK